MWSFWQNAAQLEIYGSQTNTLLDNAGVVQIFGIGTGEFRRISHIICLLDF